MKLCLFTLATVTTLSSLQSVQIMELSYQGPFVPGNKSSIGGTFVPKSEIYMEQPPSQTPPLLGRGVPRPHLMPCLWHLASTPSKLFSPISTMV